MHGSFGSLYEPSHKTRVDNCAYNLLSIAQHLSVSMLESINNWDNLRVLRQAFLFLFRNKRPQLVNIDDWSPLCIASQVESSHTHFTKVTRVVLVKVGTTREIRSIDLQYQNKRDSPVVVQTTSETTTTRVFAVLSNTSVTSRDMATVLASL